MEATGVVCRLPRRYLGSDTMAYRSIWTGALSFGMVNCPVKVYGAIDEQGISFNQLHPACLQRVRQKLWCPECEVDVERSEVLKGYPVGDAFIVMQPEDFLRVPVKTQKNLTKLLHPFGRLRTPPLCGNSSVGLSSCQKGGSVIEFVLQPHA